MFLSESGGERRRAIDEDDPLPPEDRAASPAGLDLDASYRKQRPRLLRLFARSTSKEAAPDLCQQLFVRLAALPSDHAVENPAGYVHVAADNLLVDQARREAHDPIRHALSTDAVELRAPDQVEILEARDMLRRLEAAIARLKPRTREIFLAHRFDGCSYREIAARTGLGVKAVEKHMSRAIAHIDRLTGPR